MNSQSLLSQPDTAITLDWKLKRWHYDLRTLFSQFTIPYLALKRWQYDWRKLLSGEDTEVEGIRWGVIRRETDVVIEGFPRSGNTFASVAFQFAQAQPIRIAYRLHAPIQLILATKMGIPAVLLVRHPEDAVLSWVIHRPHLTIEQALRGYIRFYAPVLPYLDQMVVADFDTVVTDYGTVIRRVNTRFHTHFDEFVHSEANVKRCFDRIDHFYQAQGGLSEQTVARPSADRKQLKEALRAEFQTERLAPLRQRAIELYEQLVQR